jgi:hypothetical protein
MVRIQPSITIDLGRAGQRISLEIKEAEELYNTLARFLNKSDESSTISASGNGRRRGRHVGATSATSTAIKDGERGRKKRGRKPSETSFSMSEAKTKEIVEHVNKQLSDTKPRTLTNLLKGISYVPNHIPLIRQAVENQIDDITKKKLGKRTYYLRGQPSKATAA